MALDPTHLVEPPALATPICGAVGDELKVWTTKGYREWILSTDPHRPDTDWCEACAYAVCAVCHGSAQAYGPVGCPEKCWESEYLDGFGPVAESMGAAPGVKHDQGKLTWDLLHVYAMEEVIKTLTFGAKKYTADGWRSVRPLKRRYIGAALRHIFCWLKGERIDEETQCHHLACACFSLMCVIEVELETGSSPLEPVEGTPDGTENVDTDQE